MVRKSDAREGSTMTDDLLTWEDDGGRVESEDSTAPSWLEAVSLRDAQLDAMYGGSWETRISEGSEGSEGL